MNDYSLKQEALDKLISYSMYRGGKVIGSLRYGKVLTAREERLMVLSAVRYGYFPKNILISSLIS